MAAERKIVSRRDALKLGGSALSLALLEACGLGGGDEKSAESSSTRVPTPLSPNVTGVSSSTPESSRIGIAVEPGATNPKALTTPTPEGESIKETGRARFDLGSGEVAITGWKVKRGFDAPAQPYDSLVMSAVYRNKSNGIVLPEVFEALDSIYSYRIIRLDSMLAGKPRNEDVTPESGIYTYLPPGCGIPFTFVAGAHYVNTEPLLQGDWRFSAILTDRGAASGFPDPFNSRSSEFSVGDPEKMIEPGEVYNELSLIAPDATIGNVGDVFKGPDYEVTAMAAGSYETKTRGLGQTIRMEVTNKTGKSAGSARQTVLLYTKDDKVYKYVQMNVNGVENANEIPPGRSTVEFLIRTSHPAPGDTPNSPFVDSYGLVDLSGAVCAVGLISTFNSFVPGNDVPSNFTTATWRLG